jgi:hypothetical protein
MRSTPDTARLRRLIYVLLITLAAGAVGGRILAVARVYEPYLSRDENDPNDRRGLWPRTRPEPMPTLGDNDRSRWDTVRALVDDGTYVIGHRDKDPAAGKYQDHGIITEDGWKTIDKVKRPDTNDFYSSKPPLLPTLVAGEYWLLKHLFGWSITEQRWSVVRVILLTVNWLPMVIYFWLLARLLDWLGSTDWGRLYVLAAGCFGTLLTPFAITLNNHSVATCAALFALYPALQIWSKPRPVGSSPASAPWRSRLGGAMLFAVAGFFAGFTATNELPAISFTAALLVLLLFHSPGPTLLFYIPAAAVPIAAHLVTNYLAIGEWAPAYEKFGGPWYEFEGSYWRIEPNQVKSGIDWAYQTEGPAQYAFHVLIGHHGIFSLSPIYLLTMAGMIGSLFSWHGRSRAIPPRDFADAVGPDQRRSSESAVDDGRTAPVKVVGSLAMVLSAVVVGFYIAVVMDRTRNYGGWTSGLRWLMWLTPLWLLSMLPAVDWLAARRWGRGLAYLFLGVSVFSASYPAWNPWRHPWLYNLLEARGLIHY